MAPSVERVEGRSAGIRVTLAHTLRAWRLRFAAALVREQDGIVVSAAAWQTALDRLAGLAEWGYSASLSKRLAESHEAAIEDVTRLLGLAAEITNPKLPMQEVRDRYVNLRLRAMSRKRRERLEYESALRTLETRGRTGPVATATTPEAK